MEYPRKSTKLSLISSRSFFQPPPSLLSPCGLLTPFAWFDDKSQLLNHSYPLAFRSTKGRSHPWETKSAGGGWTGKGQEEGRRKLSQWSCPGWRSMEPSWCRLQNYVGITRRGRRADSNGESSGDSARGVEAPFSPPPTANSAATSASSTPRGRTITW